MNILQYWGADGEASLKDLTVYHFINVKSREEATILA